MKLKGQLQWTDYLKSQLLHMRPKWATSEAQHIVISSILIFVFFSGFFFFTTGSLIPHISEILLIFLFTAFFFFLYRYIFLPNQAKKVFSQQKELGAPFEIEFSENEISISNEFGYSTKPWKNFIDWKEDRELLIVYHSYNLYNILPKRIFTSTQQIETIKSYLEKK